MTQYKVVVSIVSHGSEEKILRYFKELPKDCDRFQWSFIIRDNLDSDILRAWCYENGVRYVRNLCGRGYGANHNSNFEIRPVNTDYFLILNPDVKVDWESLKKAIVNNIYLDFAVCGARVLEPGKSTASQKRKFPTFLTACYSFFTGKKLFALDPSQSSYADWVGGSFMLWRKAAFQELRGFDESYFMYYEDVDLCRRVKLAQKKVYYDSSIRFLHEAQREGRTLFSRHFFWALRSMLKYFLKV